MNAHTGTQTQTTQQQPAAPLPTGSVLVQVSSALGGILLLILLVGWLFRRLGFSPQTRHNSKLLNLRASCQVGQRERVVVVEVENTWLVLGVTAQQITPLHTLPTPPTAETSKEAPPSADFRQLMQNLLNRPDKSA